MHFKLFASRQYTERRRCRSPAAAQGADSRDKSRREAEELASEILLKRVHLKPVHQHVPGQ